MQLQDSLLEFVSIGLFCGYQQQRQTVTRSSNIDQPAVSLNNSYCELSLITNDKRRVHCLYAIGR